MVDSVGATPITDSGTRVAATTPVTAPVAITPARTPPTSVDTAQAGTLAKSLAATAPVDSDRVATIKKAIVDGRFPIVPATIADRLIALKLQWNPNGDQNDPA